MTRSAIGSSRRNWMVAVLALALTLGTNSYAQRHQPLSNSNGFGAVGIAAYEQGDYETAKYWLNAAVYDARIIDAGGEPDPWATLYLARMHYFGDGVPQDSSLACALFEKAVRTKISVDEDSNSRAKFKRVLGGDPCPLSGAFSSEEVKALFNGCFWPGLLPAEFAIEHGSITIGRGRVRVQVGEHRWESVLMGAINACQTILITPFAHVQVSNRDGTSSRDFVYVFGIESTREGVQIARTMRWYLFEVAQGELRLRTTQVLETLHDLRSPAVVHRPELLDGVALRAGRNGKVEWALPAWHLEGSLRASP